MKSWSVLVLLLVLVVVVLVSVRESNSLRKVLTQTYEKEITVQEQGDFRWLGMLRVGEDPSWLRNKGHFSSYCSGALSDVVYFRIPTGVRFTEEFSAKVRVVDGPKFWTPLRVDSAYPDGVSVILPIGLRPGSQVDLQIGRKDLKTTRVRVNNPSVAVPQAPAGPPSQAVVAVAKRNAIYVLVDVQPKPNHVVFLEDFRVGSDRKIPTGSITTEVSAGSYMGQICPYTTEPAAVDVWAKVVHYSVSEFKEDRATLAARMRQYPAGRFQEYVEGGYWRTVLSQTVQMNSRSGSGRFRELGLIETYPINARVPVVKGSDTFLTSMGRYHPGENSPFASVTSLGVTIDEARELFKVGQPTSRLARD